MLLFQRIETQNSDDDNSPHSHQHEAVLCHLSPTAPAPSCRCPTRRCWMRKESIDSKLIEVFTMLRRADKLNYIDLAACPSPTTIMPLIGMPSICSHNVVSTLAENLRIEEEGRENVDEKLYRHHLEELERFFRDFREAFMAEVDYAENGAGITCEFDNECDDKMLL